MMADAFRLAVAPGADHLIGEALERLLAEKLGPKIQANARRTVPVEYGNLKAAIVIQVHLDGSDSVLQVGVDPDAPGRPHPEQGPTDYGLHVEIGTSKMAAQPYLRPAILQAGGTVA
jgi:HK97 gp10 family phage protein